MDKIAFRYKVDAMLVNKPAECQKYVTDKISKILDITKQDDMSLETVACIMLEADRITKETNIKTEIKENNE
jgi:hypothetical protein